MGKRVGGRASGWTSEWVGKRVGGQAGGRANGWVDERVGGQAGGWTSEWVDERVTAKQLNHSVLYNIPRSIFERGICYFLLILNELSVTRLARCTHCPEDLVIANRRGNSVMWYPYPPAIVCPISQAHPDPGV